MEENRYYHTKESVAEYIHLAKEVSGITLIKKWLQFMPVQAHVLELGSGPGTDWEILSKYFSVIGSDFSKEFIQHLKRRHPTGEFLNLDASSLLTSKKFDGIYSNKVLHHLTHTQLISSVQKQHELLHLHGVICHSFWKGEGTEEFKGLFVNYHSQEDLRSYFAPYFDIILLETYAEFEPNDSLLLIAKKK